MPGEQSIQYINDCLPVLPVTEKCLETAVGQDVDIALFHCYASLFH